MGKIDGSSGYYLRSKTQFPLAPCLLQVSYYCLSTIVPILLNSAGVALTVPSGSSPAAGSRTGNSAVKSGDLSLSNSCRGMTRLSPWSCGFSFTSSVAFIALAKELRFLLFPP